MKHLPIALVVLLSLIFVAFLMADEKPRISEQTTGVVGTPVTLPLNINRMVAWYNTNGLQEAGVSFSAGATYPKGTAQAIYSAGLMWGGYFHDGRSPVLRVNGQSFATGTRAGAILGFQTGLSEDPAAPDVRIYRIRRDFRKVDLKEDAALTYRKNLASVTNVDMAKLRAEYAKDWAEWPWEKGAPFYDTGYIGPSGEIIGANNGILDRGEDVNRNAFLDPGEDVNGNKRLDGETPGLADADQVLWFVCNDIVNVQPWRSPAAGIEMQGTIWGYNTTDHLAHTTFKRLLIIYKGLATTPDSARIDNMYFAHFGDADLGTFTDDYTGCDTTLNLGYTYNSSPVDAMFSNFNIAPPAIGYDLLQGPLQRGVAGRDLNRNGIDDAQDYAISNFKQIGPGYINIPMTAFSFFDRHTRYGSRYANPPYSSNGVIRWYQMMRGLPPIPQGPPDPDPLINPVTGQPSPFWVSGDPTTQQGWLDGDPLFPGDRQMVMVTGPITMALRDTQEIVIGLVGGVGNDYLASVKVLKYNDRMSQLSFNSNFTRPPAQPDPHLAIVPLDGKLLLDWESDPEAVGKTENTVLFGGYRFEGYNVYQFPYDTSSFSSARLIAKFDLVNGVKTISQEYYDERAGEIYARPVQYGTDNGIQRTFLVTKDMIRDRPLVNGQFYYFAVTAYNYTSDPRSPIRTVETAPKIVPAVPETPKPGTRYSYNIGDTISVSLVSGKSDAVIIPVVYNPTTQNGDAYHIRFDTTTSVKNLAWTVSNARTGSIFHSRITNLRGNVPYRVAESGFDLYVGAPPIGLRSVTDERGDNVFGYESRNAAFEVLSAYRTLRSMNGLGTTQRDYEIRFDGTGSYALRLKILAIHSDPVWVPFSVWDVGRDPSDVPIQVIAAFKDSGNTPDTWNITPVGIRYADTLYKVFEPIYITSIRYPQNDSTGIRELHIPIFQAVQSPENNNNAVHSIFITDKDLDGQPPPIGTKIRFSKFHEIQHGDIISVNPRKPITGDIAMAQQDISAITVFPNPFYGESLAPTGVTKRHVTFSHLPDRAIIRIFNLSGANVRTLVKDGPPGSSQFLTWDLQNSFGLPVASGLYIAFVEMPDLNATKTLKIVIIQGEEKLY